MDRIYSFEFAYVVSTVSSVVACQWHAFSFVEVVLFPKSTYPTKAPTPTAIITQPLYVMKMSLERNTLRQSHEGTKGNKRALT